MRVSSRTLLPALLTCCAGLLLATAAPAQKAKLGRAYFEDHHNGYKFRFPEEWLVVPVQPQEKRLGILTQMKGPVLATRVGNNQSYNTEPNLNVYRFSQGAAVTRDEEEGGGGLRGRVETASGRKSIEEALRQMYGGLRDFAAGEAAEQKVGKLVAKHQEFTGFTGDYDVVFDTFTFSLDDYDIVLVYEIALEHQKKWQKVFYQSARSFEQIDRVEAVKLTDDADYGTLLAYHKDQVSRTPGWRLLETPSKRYLIKTSCDDEDFLEAVISRLESSRDLFERDFPPAKPIQQISVVRVCATVEEFHTYGKTGGGVLGWFNPGTTELVLWDAKNYDRNISYGVMTHEGFHQYCHFLFDESEAHRWFDEGHGDYYGGFEFKGKKAISNARMKGIDRLQEIRQIMREGRDKPVAEHVRMDHPTWQSSYGYPQSWSIIYFLREGAEGKVPRRLWQKEYADIIPSYMRVLHEEYIKAWDELREEVRRQAESEGRDLEEDELEIRRLRSRLSEERKQEIWDKAINASWGQIDIEEFERSWKEFVLEEI